MSAVSERALLNAPHVACATYGSYQRKRVLIRFIQLLSDP